MSFDRMSLRLTAAGLMMMLAVQAAGAQERDYRIAAQPLGSALTQFARESGLRLLFASDIAAGQTTSGAHGTLSDTQALDALLSGTTLTYDFTSDGTVTIRPVDAPAASSQTPVEGGAVALDAIVVTGTRTPQQISETARTIYVLDGEKIATLSRSGMNLQQILGMEIPSLDASSRGTRTNFGQNLRGRGALVLIDGISLNSARSVSRQFDAIDPFNIARIEVLSGASAIYGGNATGGIINIITRKGKDADYGLHGEVVGGAETGFRGKDDLDGKASGAVTWRNDSVDMRISATGGKTGAYYDGAGQLLIPDITQTSTQYNQLADLFGNVGVQIDENQRAELTAQYYDSTQNSRTGLYFGQNFAGLRGRPDLIEARFGYRSDLDPASRRKMVNGTYTHDDLLGQKLMLQGFYRSEELDFNPFPYGTYVSGSSQDTDFYGFKGAMIAEPLDGLTLTYGVDGDKDVFTSRNTIFDTAIANSSGGMVLQETDVVGRYPKIEVSTLSGFAQASYKATDRLTLNGGWRYQYVDTKVGDFVAANQQVAIALGQADSADAVPGGSVDYDAHLFNAGAAFQITDASQLYGNFSQGFELPDPAKYYGQGSYRLVGRHYRLQNGVTVTDSALQEVQTNSFELGYRYNDGFLSANVAAYYSLSDKTITYDRQTFLISLVDQDRRVYGIEAEVTAQLPYSFELGLNGHYTRNETKDDGRWVKDVVTYASPSKVGGHVGWRNEALSLRLDGQHLFDLSDNQGDKLNGYTLFDLTGAYEFADYDMTLNFGILNLFDKDYTTLWGQRAQIFYSSLADEQAFDYKGRGRTFALSMTKRF
ncbi:TonB-dependent siderophore receptor [Aureimonas altamirensis]|uniref:TonB-dependent siderophore receptor n=1 Tax=Aureimonas altamirensis TaxID=370622 RepID=UPI000AF49479|nr:TonB-dependent receptor [Aureimonas altamirensis]